MSALLSLVNLGLTPKSGPDVQSFELAKKDLRARYQLALDDPDEQLNAGKFYYLVGETESALAAFRAVKTLDPERSISYFVGCVLAQEGHFADARKEFSKVPPSDPYYSDARKMARSIAGK